MTSHPLTSKERMNNAASTDAKNIIEEYNSRIEGHYNEEVTTSRIQYGKNEITNRSKHIIFKKLYDSFANVFIITLIIMDIFWAILDPNVIYLFILTTLVIISGTMTFIQETFSIKAANKLVSMVTTIITVRRENTEIEIDSKELVVGDIIILDTGDVVPADVRLISSNHLRVDQSALTGESGSVTKSAEIYCGAQNIIECYNLAFMGTNVVGGSAEAVVVAVGNDTIFGSMAQSLTKKRPNNAYNKNNRAIVGTLMKLMFCMVPLVFIIMLIKGYINSKTFLVNDIIEAVIFSLTLAIGLMPEMLSTIISTNLAKGAIDMSKNRVIVKDVSAIQNFGAMDILCSDKTGTLTQNRISVEACNDVYGNFSHFVEILSCTNSRNLKSAKNQIDWAIDEYAEQNINLKELDQYNFVADVPFDFIRRRSTVVVSKDVNANMMITKGAIPEILSISSGMIADGNIQTLTPQAVNEIMGLVEWYSTKGMRVLGIAHRYFPKGKTDFCSDDECDLIFTGFVVFTDPIKPSAKMAIKELKEYGIGVKILTGDNEYISRHVYDEICIDKGNIIVGTQVDLMDDQELKYAVEESNIFARLSPDNKSRIILALRANGHTVGLIGDGINDVVAMKNADISISVDTGTDIAKETASMILLEKDLSILKVGAIEGRKVYANSIKYVKMIGSVNFGYMISLIIASILFNFEPMGAMMILIFNLINDFACMAIPFDKVEDEFVHRPKKWDLNNIKSVMFRYGSMCVITDILSWIFFIFVVFEGIPAVGYENATEAVLSGANLMTRDLLPIAVLFQSLWFIEQYWVQVLVVHIVRTNKLPFFNAQSSNILILTTLIALIVGTLLPFSGRLWETIQNCDVLMSIPLYTLLWMPSIAIMYFVGAHLIKHYMLKKYGYFAC